MYRTYWPTTLREDGRPHAIQILGLWLDGVFYFATSEDSRKGANFAREGRCVVTVSNHLAPDGRHRAAGARLRR